MRTIWISSGTLDINACVSYPGETTRRASVTNSSCYSLNRPGRNRGPAHETSKPTPTGCSGKYDGASAGRPVTHMLDYIATYYEAPVLKPVPSYAISIVQSGRRMTGVGFGQWHNTIVNVLILSNLHPKHPAVRSRTKTPQGEQSKDAKAHGHR